MLAGVVREDFSEEAALDQGQQESAMCSPTAGGRGIAGVVQSHQKYTSNSSVTHKKHPEVKRDKNKALNYLWLHNKSAQSSGPKKATYFCIQSEFSRYGFISAVHGVGGATHLGVLLELECPRWLWTPQGSCGFSGVQPGLLYMTVDFSEGKSRSHKAP